MTPDEQRGAAQEFLAATLATMQQLVQTNALLTRELQQLNTHLFGVQQQLDTLIESLQQADARDRSASTSALEAIRNLLAPRFTPPVSFGPAPGPAPVPFRPVPWRG